MANDNKSTDKPESDLVGAGSGDKAVREASNQMTDVGTVPRPDEVTEIPVFTRVPVEVVTQEELDSRPRFSVATSANARRRGQTVKGKDPVFPNVGTSLDQTDGPAYVVNKNGGVHSVPESWVEEDNVGQIMVHGNYGYRWASDQEISQWEDSQKVEQQNTTFVQQTSERVPVTNPNVPVPADKR